LDSIEGRLNAVYGQASSGIKSHASKLEAELLQVDREIMSTIRLISEMREDGMEDMLKDTLKKLRDQKEQAKRYFEDVKNQQVQIANAAEDRKILELNAREIKKAKTKASPTTLKRLIHKLISAISISPQGAKIGYWTARDQQLLIPSQSPSKASDEKSGAFPFSPTGRRYLKKIQDFFNLPPLSFGPGVIVVGSGYILENGRAD